MITPHSPTYWCRRCQRELWFTLSGMGHDEKYCPICFGAVKPLAQAQVRILQPLRGGAGVRQAAPVARAKGAR